LLCVSVACISCAFFSTHGRFLQGLLDETRYQKYPSLLPAWMGVPQGGEAQTVRLTHGEASLPPKKKKKLGLTVKFGSSSFKVGE
jgi:hypothetical protein